MHRRPSGVTLSAVILAVFDLFLFFGGLLYAILAILAVRSPLFPANTTGRPAPPMHVLVIIFAVLAVITLLCAAWGISTFVGLLRMRRWARISIMVIGGCLTAFSLLELFGTILAQYTMKNMVLPPNAGSANAMATSPATLQGLFFFLEGICVAVAVIGIWWLVYFAQRRTRDAFELMVPSTPLSSTAQLNPSRPITDFSVAQPMDAAYSATDVPVSPTESVPVPRERPISMVIIAILMFLSAASMLLCCFLPVPLFFFGVEVSGVSARVVLISLAALYTLAGYGLLQRMHFGWVLAVGLQILGILNLLTLLAPTVRERWLAYMRAASQTMAPPISNPATLAAQAMQQKMMGIMLGPLMGLGAAFAVVVLVLLWRARWAYKNV